jgi:hypothetical protein
MDNNSELLAALARMEEILSRGIQVTVEPRDPAPVVMIRVTATEDHVLVPEITKLALLLHQYA